MKDILPVFLNKNSDVQLSEGEKKNCPPNRTSLSGAKRNCKSL